MLENANVKMPKYTEVRKFLKQKSFKFYISFTWALDEGPVVVAL